jgi:hypothetical protein
MLETGPALHGPPLRRTEWNRSLPLAHRAVRSCLCLDPGTAPFQLAWLTALGRVVELLVEEEQLLAGREDKIFMAIHAFERLVLKFHISVAAAHFKLGNSPPSSKVHLHNAREGYRSDSFSSAAKTVGTAPGLSFAPDYRCPPLVPESAWH